MSASLSNSGNKPSNWKVLAVTYRVPTIAACILITAFVQIISFTAHPACRSINLWDSTINYPFAEHEAFPTYTLAFVVALPIFVVYFPVCFFLFGAKDVMPRSIVWREFGTWTLAHLIAWVIQESIVDTTKLYAGRFRPDFIDRLRNEGLVVGNNPPMWNTPGNVSVDLCQHEYITNKVLREGRLSFPSGHSSNSWVSMVVLCLFLFSKLRPFYHQSMIRLAVCFLPMILAFAVMVSRTLDYRHNFSDVVTGAAIGGIAAFIGVFMNLDYVVVTGVFVPKRPTHPLDRMNIEAASTNASSLEEGGAGADCGNNSMPINTAGHHHNSALSPGNEMDTNPLLA